MPEYEAGTPIWIDVSSSDLDKTVAFYTGLFGWQADRGGPEVGGYTIFKIGDKMVAGAGPTQFSGQSPAWMQYIKTDDPEVTAGAINSNGGTVTAGPMGVMELGTLTVFQDPTGAMCGTWQPGSHKGCEVVNEANAWGWSELYTRDLARDVDFYKNVFGYNIQETEMGPGGKYTMFAVGDRAVGGALDIAAVDIPDHVPPHWLVYFAVTSLDESLKKVEASGGQSLAGPIETPMGPFSVVQDPLAAQFAIIQISSQG